MSEWITRDTSYMCSVMLAPQSDQETTLVCGTNVSVGDTVVYSFGADGGYYTVYSSDGAVLYARDVPATGTLGARGCSVPISIGCSYVVFGPTLGIRKSATVTVGEIVDAAASLDDLYSTLSQQCFSEADVQQIVNVYLASRTGGGGGGGTPGAPGKDGATFTPYVSPSGDLSWTNDKGLANPATVNISGKPGTGIDVGLTVVDGMLCAICTE